MFFLRITLIKLLLTFFIDGLARGSLRMVYAFCGGSVFSNELENVVFFSKSIYGSLPSSTSIRSNLVSLVLSFR